MIEQVEKLIFMIEKLCRMCVNKRDYILTTSTSVDTNYCYYHEVVEIFESISCKLKKAPHIDYVTFP